MDTVRIVLLLLLAAVASVAYVVLRPPASQPAPDQRELASLEALPIAMDDAPGSTLQSNELPTCREVSVCGKKPVQPLEERGDAMLFEIEALQNTPFDEAIVKPYD